MAKFISLKCDSLCFLLFTLRISVVLATSVSDRYLYLAEPYHRSEHLVAYQSLEDTKEHLLIKRDLNSQNNVNITSTSSPSPPSTLQISTYHPETTVDVKNDTVQTNKIQKDKTVSKSKVAKTAKATLNNTTSKISLLLEDTPKNLGVNGSGIWRKPVISSTSATTTAVPKPLPVPTRSTKFPPLFHNETSSSLEDWTLNDDITFSNLSDIDNKTLLSHNITDFKNDSHLYYNSEFFNDQKVFQTYWVDMSNSPDVKTHQVLSQSHRRAATVTLSFDFPFYGSLIRNVTIATGGFLYTGNYIHAWLAATQYIAPLMANFDMSLSNDSFVKFLDNGTAFTVEWEKVALQERPNDGDFTFQATLVDNGDIYFAYKKVPIKVEDINDDYHPVKVGLSDAYIIDHRIYFIRRKTIYEYHKVNFKKEDIRDSTVIRLIALPTCLDHKDCNSCVTSKLDGFNCTWCPSARHCSSNGMDRNRHTWLQKGCDIRNVTTGGACPQREEIFDEPSTSYVHDSSPYEQAKKDSQSGFVYQASILPREPSGMGVSGMITVMFLITIVIGIAAWGLYAYRNPHTTSGQILIRYRPSQWHWRRGEARYTAATIHM